MLRLGTRQCVVKRSWASSTDFSSDFTPSRATEVSICHGARLVQKPQCVGAFVRPGRAARETVAESFNCFASAHWVVGAVSCASTSAASSSLRAGAKVVWPDTRHSASCAHSDFIAVACSVRLARSSSGESGRGAVWPVRRSVAASAHGDLPSRNVTSHAASQSFVRADWRLSRAVRSRRSALTLRFVVVRRRSASRRKSALTVPLVPGGWRIFAVKLALRPPPHGVRTSLAFTFKSACRPRSSFASPRRVSSISGGDANCTRANSVRTWWRMASAPSLGWAAGVAGFGGRWCSAVALVTMALTFI